MRSLACCMCVLVVSRGCAWAAIFSSYCCIAVSILVSTFFSKISSLTPNFPCSADSVRAGAVLLSALVRSFPRRSFVISDVRAAICVSAASRRAVSFSIIACSGVGCVVASVLFYLDALITFYMFTKAVICSCKLVCFICTSSLKLVSYYSYVACRSLNLAVRPVWGNNRYSLVPFSSFSMFSTCRLIERISSLASSASVLF
jgi:hypothetical protein